MAHSILAAKRRTRARSPRTGVAAGQAVSFRKGLSPRPHSDWAAPALYGVFSLFLFLACSPALDSKFALPKTIVLSAGVFALGILLLVRNRRGHSVAPPQWALLLSLAL